jgi:PAS domain S-box-containing protein
MNASTHPASRDPFPTEGVLAGDAVLLRRSPLSAGQGCALAVGLTGLTLFLRIQFASWFGPHPVLVLFVLPVVLSAYVGGLGAGLLATALTAVGTDLLLLQPLGKMAISQDGDFNQWLLSIAVGVLASVLSESLHRARQRIGTTLVDLRRVQAANARFAAIVESSEDAIISKTLAGVIISWNSGAEKVFGYSAAEMVGQSILKLFPPERVAEEDDILHRIGRGESVRHYETVRVRKDVKRIFVSVTISPIKGPEGRIVAASKIARDITLVKEHELELARLSRLYAGLSQVNQAIVWTPSREELFQKICQIFCQHGQFGMAWIGFHEPETGRIVPVAACGDEDGYLQRITVRTEDVPEGRGPAGTAFREARSIICNDSLNDPSSLPWREEIQRRGWRAMAAFPICEQGQVVGTLNVYADEAGFFRDKEIALLEEAAMDVSFALDNFVREEERRAAAAIAERERIFSDTMIESLPGILYLYNEQGHFLRWNQNFERLSGYSGAEIATMHPLDFSPPEERRSLEERIKEVFARGNSCIEASFMNRQGETTPYYFTGQRILFDDQVCLVGMGIDISERKQAEQALRILNENLEHKVADRTRELQAALVRAEAADQLKSSFLATMSHELRTPLNSIIGFSGIMLQGLAGPLNPEQTKQLGMVRTSSRHLLELINDVLDLSKIEAGQVEVRAEPVDLRELIDRVIALARPLADKKGLALSAKVSPEVGEIVSDRRRVEQILLNLVNNALKFTEQGGVTVTAAVSPPAVCLRVADTGIGIKPEDLEKLFQPFRQIDTRLAREHDGTGLGLVICRRLATLLGGEISVSSEWARGSEFTMSLPLEKPNHR